MESQPQNPEFRINPANFHPCKCILDIQLSLGKYHILLFSHPCSLYIKNGNRTLTAVWRNQGNTIHYSTQLSFFRG